MNMRKISLLIVIAFIFSGCADVEPHVRECMIGHEYGFFGGLWHGMISPLAFICSLFSNDIAVYAQNNNGGWYTFGFLLGIGAFGGGCSQCTKK